MFDTVLCDLDGVIWLAHHPIPGSAAAVADLRTVGCRVLFVTNNSNDTVAVQEAALASVGIDAVGDVVTSAMAAASLIQPDQRVLVTGGLGVAEAVMQRTSDVVVNTGDPVDGWFDAVIVGLHREFDYRRLAVAARAVHAGARLIGTNADPTFPTPSGLDPGAGSILAAVAVAAGVEPVLAGKPNAPMAAHIVGDIENTGADFDSRRTLMVGDRLDTDGAFAVALGCHFALVRSGVTLPGPLPDVGALAIALDRADLAAVARSVRNGEGDW